MLDTGMPLISSVLPLSGRRIWHWKNHCPSQEFESILVQLERNSHTMIQPSSLTGYAARSENRVNKAASNPLARPYRCSNGDNCKYFKPGSLTNHVMLVPRCSKRGAPEGRNVQLVCLKHRYGPKNIRCGVWVPVDPRCPKTNETCGIDQREYKVGNAYGDDEKMAEKAAAKAVKIASSALVISKASAQAGEKRKTPLALEDYTSGKSGETRNNTVQSLKRRKQNK